MSFGEIFIHCALRDFIESGKIIIYLDDLSIATMNFNTLYILLLEVLQRLSSLGLGLNLKKCSFAYKTIDYLCYTINESGVSPIDSHLTTLAQYPPPKNLKQLQSYLGLFRISENL